ncbi:MAG: phosphodiester glycosidase family protein [Cellulomonas sp.]|nr:phosphodiester glycosidase family protein [Cellulomonas sp.]
MRRSSPALGLAGLLASLAVAAPAAASDTWSTPSPGIRRLVRTTATQHVNALVVDLCAPGVSVRTTATAERGRTVASFGALVGAQAAVNGDFFVGGFQTDGPAMHAGVAWGGGDHGYVAPVQFGEHRVALPPHEGTGGVAPWAREVVSGHPTLLVAGVRRDNNGDSVCTTRNPRTGVGFSADHTKMFVAVVDGRATTRIGMTCDELVALLQERGASDAVNPDGGGSSTMWLPGSGVVSVPSDGVQRAVGDHLAILATGTGDAAQCPLPAFDASAPQLSAPLELTSGDEAVVWMELKNDGRSAWTLATTKVGTQDPQDRASVFFKPDNWPAANRPSAVDHDEAPGSVGRFTWAMVAPEVTTPTQYDETFQLVQEGVAWFGPKQTMSIMVHPRTDPGPGDGPADPPSAGCSAGSSSGGGGGGWLAAVGPMGVLGLGRRRRVRAPS